MFKKINDTQFSFTNKNNIEHCLFTLKDNLSIVTAHEYFLKIEGDFINDDGERVYINEGITPRDFYNNIFGNYDGDSSFEAYIKDYICE